MLHKKMVWILSVVVVVLGTVCMAVPGLLSTAEEEKKDVLKAYQDFYKDFCKSHYEEEWDNYDKYLELMDEKERITMHDQQWDCSARLVVGKKGELWLVIADTKDFSEDNYSEYVEAQEAECYASQDIYIYKYDNGKVKQVQMIEDIHMLGTQFNIWESDGGMYFSYIAQDGSTEDRIENYRIQGDTAKRIEWDEDEKEEKYITYRQQCDTFFWAVGKSKFTDYIDKLKKEDVYSGMDLRLIEGKQKEDWENWQDMTFTVDVIETEDAYYRLNHDETLALIGIKDLKIKDKDFSEVVNKQKGMPVVSIVHIGKCKNLVEVIIPEKVKEVWDGVFTACENVKKVQFPDSIEYIGTQENAAFKVYGKSEVAKEFAQSQNLPYVDVAIEDADDVDEIEQVPKEESASPTDAPAEDGGEEKQKENKDNKKENGGEK